MRILGTNTLHRLYYWGGLADAFVDIMIGDKMISCSSRIAKISELHKFLEFNLSEDPQKTKDQLKRQLRAWLDDHVTITCIVDTREQLPYTEKETGLPHVTQKNETGDYCFYAEWTTDEGETTKFDLGLIIERKTVNDFYSTLMVKKNCDRFYREIERTKDHDFFIFVEGSEAEYLSYVIPAKRRNMKAEIIKTNSARRGKLASLEMRGAHVCFKSSRLNSCLDLKKYAEQWLLKHYAEVLDL